MTTIDHLSFTTELAEFIGSTVAVGDEQVEADTDLVITGLVDSLGVLVIVEWIEAKLGIMIDPGDIVIEHFDMVSSMVQYLRDRGDTALD